MEDLELPRAQCPYPQSQVLWPHEPRPKKHLFHALDKPLDDGEENRPQEAKGLFSVTQLGSLTLLNS